MYKYIKIQKKPNKDSLFFFEQFKFPKEYYEYTDKNYKKTGKLISIEKKLSDDKLKMTIITIWKSRKDFLSYITDPYIFEFNSQSTNYDIDNDIVNEVFIEKDDNE